MPSTLLTKLERLPADALSREPLASLLALETQRHHDPTFAARRRAAKLADRRRVLTFIATMLLVGVAVLAMPYVVPGVVASIVGLVARHFGVLCVVAVFGGLGAITLERSWAEVPRRWGDELLCACLVSASVAAGMLLIAASSLRFDW